MPKREQSERGPLRLTPSQAEQFENELRRSRVFEVVGQLAGGIAHDFNNILGSIVGCLYSARLQAAGRPELVAELDRAQALCKRGGDLTRQLLTVARRRPGTIEPLDLGPLLEEAGELLQRSLPKTVKLKVSSPRGLPPVHADRSTLTAALLSLGLNARDAMKGGGELQISALLRKGARGRPRRVVVEVSDTGVGIPEELRAKVFEPFYTTKAPGEGVGLGLSIVDATLKECGGTVSLRAREGGGTTIALELRPVRCPRARPGRPEEPAAFAPAPGARVLVVEDERDMARLVSRVLANAGYECLGAETGLEALERVRDHRESLRLVVLDLMLSELGGEEVFRLLRGIAPEVPILLVTGREDLARALAPAELVLPKPFTAEELLRCSAAAISLGRGPAQA